MCGRNEHRDKTLILWRGSMNLFGIAAIAAITR
jgi:hypothetical protein